MLKFKLIYVRHNCSSFRGNMAIAKMPVIYANKKVAIE